MTLRRSSRGPLQRSFVRATFVMGSTEAGWGTRRRHASRLKPEAAARTSNVWLNGIEAIANE